MKTAALGIALLFVCVTISYGGWFDTTLENVGKSLGNRAVNDAGNSAYGAAKSGASDAVKKKPTGKKSVPVEDDAADDRETGRSKSKPDSSADSSENPGIDDAESLYSKKYDFIPGDKLIFYDDFSDTDVGEFPHKWTLEGPKHSNNAVEVVEYKGKRFLRGVPSKKSHQDSSTQYIRLKTKGDLPEKFTVEFDAILGDNGNSSRPGSKHYTLLLPKGGRFPYGGTEKGGFSFNQKEGISANTKTAVDLNDNKIHHIAVSVNGTFVKAYIDGTRVINDPDGLERPIARVGIYMYPRGGSSENLMFTNFRLAEGGKDIKSALETDGKIITHGIQFDTGSDVIKPESLPTLKSILALLTDDSELRFSIEGHTDNQGKKVVNQPLSEKRAAAVKQWLVGKGIDSSRLSTKGFGDSKPLGQNSTSEGRANNRRVEFIKL